MADYPPISSLIALSLLDSIPEVCCIYRNDGLLMAVNTACEKFTGVPRDIVVGKFNLFENPHVIDPPLLQGYAAVFRGESQVVPPTQINLRQLEFVPEATDAELWLETLLVPMVKDDQGNTLYVLVIQRDVTELMKTREKIEEARKEIAFQRDTIDALHAARREIEAQKATIQALSVPIIEVWDGVLTLPLIGHVDAGRAGEAMSRLLEAVVRSRARYAILDFTGIAVMDETTADHIRRIVSSVALLGATGLLAGIRADVAQALVHLGVELDRVRVYQNVRQALKACIHEGSTGSA